MINLYNVIKQHICGTANGLIFNGINYGKQMVDKTGSCALISATVSNLYTLAQNLSQMGRFALKRAILPSSQFENTEDLYNPTKRHFREILNRVVLTIRVTGFKCPLKLDHTP